MRSEGSRLHGEERIKLLQLSSPARGGVPPIWGSRWGRSTSYLVGIHYFVRVTQPFPCLVENDLGKGQFAAHLSLDSSLSS
jgi:hypothetical protein